MLILYYNVSILNYTVYCVCIFFIYMRILYIPYYVDVYTIHYTIHTLLYTGRQCMASCFYLMRQFDDVMIYMNSIKAYMYNDDDFNYNYGITLAATR